MAVQLVHESSGALLCLDVQEKAVSEGFGIKVMMKTPDLPPGEAHRWNPTHVLAMVRKLNWVELRLRWFVAPRAGHNGVQTHYCCAFGTTGTRRTQGIFAFARFMQTTGFMCCRPGRRQSSP